MNPNRLGPETASVYVAGDVQIAADVAIAPGAVLQAAPGSQVVIATGVCLGAAVVIQARGGALSLEAGVTVGQGGLILGTGLLGKNACIGADSTLINPQIAPEQMVPARSLLGDPSPPQICSVSATAPGSPPETGALPDQSPHSPPQKEGTETLDPNRAENGNLPPPEVGTLATHTVVYGREQVMQLIQTLFPHRQSLAVPESSEHP
ncbi:hypothetical protein [Leptolyngbya sp. PCC 6406]|uniref:hypothetical protein n=1 Tax=Leptolyngbya sp. PCC 6406 TaxID=1173264 RepID=UPI0002ACD2B2|nr:hypothetical protein [Leptolyngbya sp. PCC 6406]